MSNRLLKYEQAAEITGTPLSWWYEMGRHDALPVPVVKIGKYRRISEKALISWIESGGQNNKADAP